MDDGVGKPDVGSTGVTFPGLLLRWRQAARLTQEELATKAGLSSRTIQNIERGKVNRPHKESVRLLADALDLPASARAEFHEAAGLGAANVSPTHPLGDDDLSRFSVRQLLHELERRFGVS